jgi:nicotinamide mononucleotide adenylyltransferase
MWEASIIIILGNQQDYRRTERNESKAGIRIWKIAQIFDKKSG